MQKLIGNMVKCKYECKGFKGVDLLVLILKFREWQGNSTLLFKRSSIISTGSSNNSGAGEDYDYVNLDSREVVAKQREEVRASLPQELRSNYDLLVSESDNATIQMPPTTPTPMDPNDKQLLAFYAAQVITHGNHLTHAIDAFMQTVEHNQPPKASTVNLEIRIINRALFNTAIRLAIRVV